ncbi:MAG: GNAT family N-acetyltransferase [Candidatus Micrarchaeota archaeon]|nr:GNAT family N-acetyltransferase [Candidatus Micrarchaeota archaeon]
MKMRKAGNKDIVVLAKLLHNYDVFEHDLDKRVEVTSEREYKKYLSKTFRDNSTTYIIAEDGSKPVGFISYVIWKQGKMSAGAIQDTLIIDGHRGKGIGKALVRYVINKMKKAKCEYVKSGVRVKNKRAQKFWKKQGFKVNFNQVDYSMRKEL